MTILYLHQYFKLPSEAGATRSFWMALELVKKGHEVIIIASKDLKVRKHVITVDGINVIYLNESYDQNMSIFRRLKAFLSFVSKCIQVANKLKNIDLVIATSTPLTIGIPALWLKWFKNIPYVFEVRDLWPEVPIQMGAIKSSLIIKLTRLFEKTIYKNAEHVIALSPGMQEGVLKYVPKRKTTMIPNMAKKDEFWPREKNKELEKELGLNPRSFKLVHFGSLGLANGCETILESAKLLKANDSIEFLFVGGGSMEEHLKLECTKNGLKNVKFLGRFSMKYTSEIVNLSDVSIVSFKDLPILYTNSPNKLFDSLSAGKPIIVNSAGWTKEMVKNHNCGYYFNPNYPQELVDIIKYLQNHPEIVMKMGANARKLAEEKYDKSILSKQFVKVIDGIKVNA
jgi:glycosyltransferase involved in cell wall biosynthesis